MYDIFKTFGQPTDVLTHPVFVTILKEISDHTSHKRNEGAKFRRHSTAKVVKMLQYVHRSLGTV